MGSKLVTALSKAEIYSYLRQNPALHIYSIGDLDEFFYKDTRWYGLQRKHLETLLLLYTRPDPPVLLAICDTADLSPHKELLKSAMDLLPDTMYSHVTPGLEEAIEEDYHMEHHGSHLKMALEGDEYLKYIDRYSCSKLADRNIADIEKLYGLAYPGNWFDPYMLKTGMYLGIYAGNELVSIAGVHVYSEEYSVAALGNITTHPDYRGMGYGTAVTAYLCRELSKKVGTIGLNVKADNVYAIRSYKKLGFRETAKYEEYTLRRKSS